MTFEEYPLHDSPRGYFGRALYFEMQKNPDIILLTADLGYKIFDLHFKDFPDRCINAGAAEQCAMGAAIGLALLGKIPFVYSITSFLLYRPFEWLRNFVNHENIPVRLVGSGLDNDYAHDGITHQTFDAKAVLGLFPNIESYFPSEKAQVPVALSGMISHNEPSFLCLRR